MRLVGFGSLDLTVFGQLKALFCTGVGFQLGHFIFLLNVITAYWRGQASHS